MKDLHVNLKWDNNQCHCPKSKNLTRYVVVHVFQNDIKNLLKNYFHRKIPNPGICLQIIYINICILKRKIKLYYISFQLANVRTSSSADSPAEARFFLFYWYTSTVTSTSTTYTTTKTFTLTVCTPSTNFSYAACG